METLNRTFDSNYQNSSVLFFFALTCIITRASFIHSPLGLQRLMISGSCLSNEMNHRVRMDKTD